MKHVISLGAGVQSSTMALMAAHGEIEPMPDCAIFADTQAEPESVYKWLDWLETKLPFPVHRVTKGDLAEDGLEIRTSGKSGKDYQKNLIPMFVLNADGSKGILGRKCTRDYKIDPIVRKVRQLAQITRGQKTLAVSQWIGISTDEATRMKMSDKPFIANRWPLIELGISRFDCFEWMSAHKYPEPPRSACGFCPYHSDREWFRLKTEEPKEFAKAVAWEKKCQTVNIVDQVTRGVPFLHSSLTPLDEVPFDKWIRDERRQINLFENECEGMCGV